MKKITYATTTNIGGRTVNEDSIGAFNNDNSMGFIVCDGLGGHGLGDVASQITVETFKRELNTRLKTKLIIRETFEKAQEAILYEQQKQNSPDKIKTTAVLTVLDKSHAHIGYIGDSRLYIFKGDKVLKQTLDHSVPQMLVLSKEIKAEDIRNHPERNMLLRVMGTEWREPQYDIWKAVPLRKIQAMLLCTDGFWELIDENAMCQCLKDANNVDEWLNTMVKIVEINGSGQNMDNFSAIAIWNERK